MHNKKSLIKVLNSLIIVASLILVISISIETFRHDSFLAHSIYFEIQFWICICFTVCFFVFFYFSENKLKFMAKYSILLFLSIPYLAILDYSSIHLTQEQIYLISFIPLLRGGVALVMLILLLVERNTTAIFISYFSVHDKFHRTLILSGFCLLKIAKISLNSSFFPKPIKR